MFDTYCVEKTTHNPNMLIPFYLMAAYAYYHLDDPILTDSVYDQVCKDIAKYWDEIDHYHKHLVNLEDMEAGTCLLAEEDFPAIIKGAIQNMCTKKEQPKKTALKNGLLAFF